MMETKTKFWAFLLTVSLVGFVQSQDEDTCISGDELNNKWSFQIGPNDGDLTCPPDWIRRGHHCYKAFNTSLTKEGAQSECRSDGGELVKLGDSSVIFFNVEEVLRYPLVKLAWTGLEITEWANCTGEWEDGSLGGGFNGQWEVDRPMAGLGDCVALSSCSGRFTNLPCSEKLPYICQQRACRTGNFHCTNNICVPSMRKCDGVDDCGDWSDELLDECDGTDVITLTESSPTRTYELLTADYLDNDEIFIKVEGPPGSKLQLSLDAFDSEEDKDVLEIYILGATFETSTFLTSVSGVPSPLPQFISANNRMLLRWATDNSNKPPQGGFTLTATIEFPCQFRSELIENTMAIPSPADQVSSESLQDCLQTCLDDEDCLAISYVGGNTCRRHIGFLFALVGNPDAEFYRKACPKSTAELNQLSLPNGGEDLVADTAFQSQSSPYYPRGQLYKNLELSWKITTVTNDGIITFSALDMSDLAEGDVVKVFDGPVQDDARLLAEYRWNTNGKSFVVSTMYVMTVTYKSTSENPGGGINFGYQLGCRASVVTSTAEFCTPGADYPGSPGYPEFLDCQFLFFPKNPEEPFTMFFGPTDIKEGDLLTVSTGEFSPGSVPVFPHIMYTEVLNTESEIVTMPPENSWNSTSYLRVSFITNGVTTGDGFCATVSGGCMPLNITDPHISIFSLDNSSISTIPREFNSTVYITCNPGYYLASEEFGQCPSNDHTKWFPLQCGKNGQWNVRRIPECAKRSCGRPDVPTNGYIYNITGVETDDAVTYKCIPGLDLIGLDVSVCMDGNWESPPTCQGGECPVPANLTNGRYIVEEGEQTSAGFTQDSILEYICNPGYSLTKGYKVVCKDGMWIGETDAKCDPLNCKIPRVQRGVVVSNSVPMHPVFVPHMEMVEVECDEGYVVVNTTDDVRLFTCDRSDQDMPDGSFGPNWRMEMRCVDHDECNTTTPCAQECINTVGSYRCECSEGYMLDNDRTSCIDYDECMFLDSLPNCVNMVGQECKDIIQRCHNCSNETPGFSCSCDSGYHLWDPTETEAYPPGFGENGMEIWHIRVANVSCVRNTCNSTLIPEAVNGSTRLNYQSNYYFGDKVEYLCQIGTSVGETTKALQYVECDPNGDWMNPDTGDGTLNNCTAVSCPEIDISHLQDRIDLVNPDLSAGAMYSQLFGATVYFNCTIPGRNMVDERSQQCVFDATNETYRLVGDPLECEKIDCGPLPFISGLDTTNINMSDTYYGYSFNFTCENAFNVTGNSTDPINARSVTCQSNGQWDLGDLTCVGPTCTDPGTPPHAMQMPVGDYLSYEAGSSVDFECLDEGFTYNANRLTCEIMGASVQWNGNVGVCEDTQAPNITCPTDTYYFLTGEIFIIPLPMVTDNVGVASIQVNPPLGEPILNGPAAAITAMDFNGNTYMCNVLISVADPNPPQFFNNCSMARAIVINDGQTEMRSFNDTSLESIMENAEIQKLQSFNFEPSSFSVGEADVGSSVEVVVTATNFYDDISSCTILYNIEAAKCAQFAIEAPSANVVKTEDSATQITMTCVSDSYIFGAGYDHLTSIVYTCDPTGDGVWMNNGNSYVPDCTLTIEAEFQVDITVYYKYEDSTAFDPLCVFGVQNLAAENQFIVDETNFINSVANVLFSNDIDKADCKMDLDAIDITTVAYTALGDLMFINYRYTLREKPGRTATTSERNACVTNLQNRYTAEYLESPLSTNGHATISGVTECSKTLTADKTVTLQMEVEVSDQVECDSTGVVLFTTVCANCARGYYLDNTTTPYECKKCPIGEYQDVEGETSCKMCDPGTSTAVEGAQHSSQCLNTCPPGFISDAGNGVGLSPCQSVKPDYYWVDPNNETMCPNGTINSQGGGKSESDCKGPCGLGEFSASGYAPCKPCPQGFYQDNTLSDECKQCQGAETTPAVGTVSGGECTSNATGLCDGGCGEKGYCIIDQSVPRCNCTEGFKGDNCEIAPNPCASNPCYNGGMCMGFPNNTYTCTCAGDVTANMVLYMNETDLTNRLTTNPTTVLQQFGATFEVCKELCINNDECVYAIVYGPVNPGSGPVPCVNVLVEDLTSLATEPITTDTSFATRLIFERVITTEPHHDGPRCEDLVFDPCVGQCMNGAQCHTIGHQQFECLCLRDSVFSGTYCNETEDICDRDPCYNDGTCDGSALIRRICDCPFGYDSHNCNRTINFCDVPQCFYGGVCVNDLTNPDGFHCNCNEQYDGPRCEIRPDDVCEGVQCLDDQYCYTNPATGDYACVCIPGKTQSPDGKTCEEIDKCEINPCFNNGSCMRDPDNPSGYTCTCLVGQFRGAQCQEMYDPCDPDENLCVLDNSECRIDVNGTGYCECDPGFDGPDCGNREDLCQRNLCNQTNLQTCSRDGENGISFNDYECTCMEGFTGKHCEHEVSVCDTYPCINGNCENSGDSFACSCDPGWTGETCHDPIDICDDNPCVHGSCTMISNDTRTCLCDEGQQYGEDCENDIDACSKFSSELCSGKGTCVIEDGVPTCNCDVGQSGDSCQCLKDFCTDDTCQNDGICETLAQDFQCHCAPGFSGRNCETNIDDCASLEGCVDCVDGVKKAFCRCPHGMTGSTCDRVATYDYDLKFTGIGSSRLLYPAVFNASSSSFTLVVFVRYREDTSGQVLLLCAADDETIPECEDGDPILTLDEQNFCLNGESPGSCFEENLNLNSGEWTRVIFTYDGTEGQLIVGGTILSSKNASIDIPEFVMINVGGDEDGELQASITRLEIYNRVLTSDEINEVSKNEQLSQPPDIPWDFYRPVGVQYVFPSEFCISSCSVQGRNAPGIEACPENAYKEKTDDVARALVSWRNAMFESSTPLQVDSNFKNNDNLDGGAYDIAITATNPDGDFAQCIFPAYVSYDVCPMLMSTETVDFTCTDYVNNMYTSCTPSCKDSVDFVFLEPVPKKINCGPSGVFDPVNPTETFQISECGRRCRSLLDINFSWNYTADFEIAQIGLNNIVADVKTLITNWEDENMPNAMCEDDRCNNVNVTYAYSHPDLQIEVMASSAQHEIERDGLNISTEIAIKEAVIAIEAAFDVLLHADTLSRTYPLVILPRSLDYVETVSCNEPGCQPQTDYCVECTAGTYLNTTWGRCEPCMKNHYQNETGRESCRPCPVGKITEGEGSRSEDFCFDMCPPGEKYDKTNKTCVECGYGFFQSEPGQTDCDQCNAGETTLVRNATNATQCKTACDNGQELGPDSITCIDCRIGSYRTKDVDVRCKECISTRTTPGPGSETVANCSLVKCPAGEYRVGDSPGNCTRCSPGTWRADHMNATVCASCDGSAEVPGVMYTTVMPDDEDIETDGATNHTQCRAKCLEGDYLNVTTGECIKCPKDTYKTVNQTFAVECTPCPEPNVFTQGEGATSVEECQFSDCSAGQTVNVTNSTCVDCPIGYYQPEPNPTNHSCIVCPMKNMHMTTTINASSSSESDCLEFCPHGEELIGGTCMPCEYGFYKNNDVDNLAKFGNCTMCPTNTTTPNVGSTDAANCTIADCGLGEYLNLSDECEPCAVGYYQAMDWRETPPPADMDPYIRMCQKCDDGTSTNDVGKTSVTDCNKFCESGEQDNNGTCTLCPRGTYKDNTISLAAQYGECELCPADSGMTTIDSGSISKANCSIVICGPGEYRNTSNLCQPCAVGTYNGEMLRDGPCIPCGVDVDGSQLSTTGERATSLENCTVYPNRRVVLVKWTIIGRTPSTEQKNPDSTGTGSSSRRSLLNRFLAFLRSVLKIKFIVKDFTFTNGKEDFAAIQSSTLLVGTIELDTTGSGIADVIAEVQRLLDAAASAGSPSAELEEIIAVLEGSGPFTSEATADGLDPDAPLTCAPGEQIVVLIGTGTGTFTSECQACPVNYYHQAGNIPICSKCPDGTTTDGNVNRTSVDDCKLTCGAGNYSSGGTDCLLCPLNEYKEAAGTGSCDLCPMTEDNPPKQQITLQEGTSDPDLCQGPCAKGYYYERTPGNKCLQCPRGMYNDEVNALSCKSCNTHYYTASAGSVSASDCKPVCGPEGVYPEYCMNGGSCDWNDEFKMARCSCADPYEGERCDTRGEPTSDTNVILIGVFSALGGILLLLMVILAIRYHYMKRRKHEEHEDRKRAIRGNNNMPYGQLAPVMAAPVPVTANYYDGFHTYGGADALSLPGYGIRQTGNPTPPRTLHAYQPTYDQNPGPSMYDMAHSKAMYYDEKEPGIPGYGTQGYGGGRGLYGTNIYNRGGGGSVFQGNY